MQLTGTWVFNAARSKLQISAPDSTILTIDHQPTLFRLSRTHVSGGKADQFSIELPIGGEEVVVRHGDHMIRSRCYWDGPLLVFDSVIVKGTAEYTNVVTYELSADGSLLTADERFRGPDLQYTNVWILDRENAI
jgi:hypothetical protein